jgi:hypothetical protein
MQYPFNPKLHEVPAAAFFCLDPRFWEKTIAFVQKELGFKEFDPYVQPGGPRVLIQDATRNIFLDDIKRVSINLHHIKEVVLIAHRDCGAYGGSKFFESRGGLAAERTKQEGDLKKARETLNEKFPQLKVSLYYLEIVGEKIEFQPVP